MTFRQGFIKGLLYGYLACVPAIVMLCIYVAVLTLDWVYALFFVVVFAEAIQVLYMVKRRWWERF